MVNKNIMADIKCVQKYLQNKTNTPFLTFIQDQTSYTYHIASQDCERERRERERERERDRDRERPKYPSYSVVCM